MAKDPAPTSHLVDGLAKHPVDRFSKASQYPGLILLKSIASKAKQCDLLDLPAVTQLEKDTKYAPMYQLLKIFVTQRLDAYMEFHSLNSKLLNTYGLVHEDCVAKIYYLW